MVNNCEERFKPPRRKFFEFPPPLQERGIAENYVVYNIK